jgi:hypothetical protein
MFSPSRAGPYLAALIVAGLAAGSATAKDAGHRVVVAPPVRPHLMVIEGDQEFSIQPASTGAPCATRIPAATTSRLALGLNLKLDRSLFSAAVQARPESPDAPRR